MFFNSFNNFITRFNIYTRLGISIFLSFIYSFSFMENLSNSLVKTCLVFQTSTIVFFVVVERCWVVTVKVSDTEPTIRCICSIPMELNQAINRKIGQAIRTNDLAVLQPYDWPQSTPDASGYQSRRNMDRQEQDYQWQRVLLMPPLLSKVGQCDEMSMPRTIESSIITTRLPLTTPETADSFHPNPCSRNS